MKADPNDRAVGGMLQELGLDAPEWLQGGRILVGTAGDKVLRAGSAEDIGREASTIASLPADLRAFAPAAHGEAEADGWRMRAEERLPPAADPRGMVQAWLDARQWEPQAPVRATLRSHLKNLQPHGKLSVTELVRRLRRAREQGAQLPFPPQARRIERVLGKELEVCYHRGWIHGSLLPRRIREGGFICWRQARPDGLRGTDAGAHVPPEDQPLDILLHVLKWSWRNSPVRAARCLAALGAEASEAKTVLLEAEAHPGLGHSALRAILGCGPGTVETAAAKRALGRTRKLTVGGRAISVTCKPAVKPSADPGFFLPRGRSEEELFSRFGQGILLDEEGRYSLTPEREAMGIASTLEAETVVDAFCGCGGNAIAFARMPGIRKVVAIDSHPGRLRMARANARIYGVENKIDFLCGDALACAPPAAAVFADPPWAAGEARLSEIWSWARARYEKGAIKLPKEHPVPDGQEIGLICSAEGYPRYMLLGWGGWSPAWD